MPKFTIEQLEKLKESKARIGRLSPLSVDYERSITNKDTAVICDLIKEEFDEHKTQPHKSYTLQRYNIAPEYIRRMVAWDGQEEKAIEDAYSKIADLELYIQREVEKYIIEQYKEMYKC